MFSFQNSIQSLTGFPIIQTFDIPQEILKVIPEFQNDHFILLVNYLERLKLKNGYNYFTDLQLEFLSKIYLLNKYPSNRLLQWIAMLLNTDISIIENWFRYMSF
jgi:hypothetical protein